MMTQMEKAPFRNDIVGSFLRPQSIKNAREAVQEGTMTITDLRNIENEAIQKLVDKQVSVGLKSVTDGEFRRSWWHLDFMWGLEGVEKVEIDEGYRFVEAETRAESARLTGKLGG